MVQFENKCELKHCSFVNFFYAYGRCLDQDLMETGHLSLFGFSKLKHLRTEVLSASLIWAFHFSDLSGVRTQHYNYSHDTSQGFWSFFCGEPRKADFL